MTVTGYIGRMKALSDEMAAAGRKLEDDELVEYILIGLDEEYNSLVSTVLARTDPISVSELYSLMLAFETRVDLHTKGNSFESLANTTCHGRGHGGGPGCSNQGNRGGRGPRSPAQHGSHGGFHHGGLNGGSRNNNSGTSSERLLCQVCFMLGHTTDRCWNKYDENYVHDSRHVAAAAVNTYMVDPNWYTDIGATDHIMGELEKLALWEKYHGAEQIHTVDGAGMDICHVGETTIHTQHRDLKLKNILHVPQATKNLDSVHCFTTDNNVFLEFHPFFFLIKNRIMRRPLFRGRCHKGLYPLPTSFTRQAIGVSKPSFHKWHSRLGHPAVHIVHKVISLHNLPCHSEVNKDSVCDACQQAKSHQLSYPKSTSVSSQPLELVYSDVWGPAPKSVGRYKYYVSFIDDFSKFTWIYLLKHKSEVFQKFKEFQTLVEPLFDRKILAIQSDWGGEYEKLNSFFTKIRISHHVSCPHAHQQNVAVERKHRHIVEVGLSLLAQAHMPLKFWDETFLSATYLINHTPSKVIS
jgi:hypothetical protein